METSKDKKDSDAFDVVRLVDDLLARATDCGASDIHFEPTADEMQIRFRLDGVLNTVETLPSLLRENVVSRLKVLGGLLTYRNDIPQEGRLASNGDGTVVDRRLAVFPTIHGQRAVVRLFYDDPALADLNELGFRDKVLANLKQLIESNGGVILLTGPAGSGKSTTLAAILRHITRVTPGKSIVTLEDPVERHIRGVTQVQITPQGTMTFPTALRSLLRQDPEVLMIGEIRDAETARIAVEAGLTGHLLLSTLHSGTPSGALLRLLEMGVEPYQVTSSVLAVVNQRLLRKLCEHCRRKDSATGQWQAAGCEKCFGTGYHGRALVAEMLLMQPSLREAILAKSDANTLKRMLEEQGHTPIAVEGCRLVEQGITTQAELDRVSA
ncbi:MAG: type II/IV secretion system protein [Phycisphaerae bacterium]|nr:type II/IV secretion system protein [Phycisphaerae bacterium]